MTISESRWGDVTSTDSILDDLFHGCAFSAFVEQALVQRGWPDTGATKQKAFKQYEAALKDKTS